MKCLYQTKKWALCICAQGCRLLLFCWILEHVWQSGICFIFVLSETVLIHEVLVVEVTLKVCVKRQSHTSKSSRFIFNWCKICSFVSNVILLTPSPLFYHNTIIWSSTNWCDLKSVQLYALRYSFKSVKLYVIIFCHAWLILEWHYV